jgi:sugar lactone lactonase YvrE
MANNKDFKVKNGIQPTAYHEGLGTVTSGSEGYSLANGVFDSINFSVASQDNDPHGLAFKTDGTSFYIVGRTGDKVYQYDLSTAWDLSTASYASKSFSYGQGEGLPMCVRFKPDGTKMYIVGLNNDTIYQYSLSTAWDVSTASYDSKSFSVTSQEASPSSFVFNSDGTKLILCGYSTDSLYEYTLSTAYDISTASYTSVSYNPSVTNPFDMTVNSDGTKLYLISTAGEVSSYTLSTAYDISSASKDATTFDSTGQTLTAADGIAFKSDGTKMYLMSYDADAVFQYSTTLTTATLDLSTGSVFEITPTSDIQIGLSNPADSGTVSQATLLLDGAVNGYDLSGAAYDSISFSVTSQDTEPTLVWFKPDGEKMYVKGGANEAIYQYSLNTAWDISSASYDSVSFSLTSQTTSSDAGYFKPDGTKLYVTSGIPNDEVLQYSLSTAWDLSTASYDSKSFDISAQTAVPFGLYFKSDGTKMYVVSTFPNDDIYQYSLSTAWDVSTASYDSVSFNLNTQITAPYGIEANPDGTAFYIHDTSNQIIHKYSLSSAWDLSSISYSGISFDISSQDAQPRGIKFGNDGLKLYTTGNTNDSVYQYTTGSAYTVTYDSTLQWGGGTAPDSPAANETDVLTFSTRDGGTTYQAVQAISGAS